MHCNGNTQPTPISTSQKERGEAIDFRDLPVLVEAALALF